MNTFIAILDDSLPDAALERIKLSTSAMYEITDRIFLIRAYADNPANINLLFNEPGQSESSLVRVVFKLNGSYSGFYYPELWQWLQEARAQANG